MSGHSQFHNIMFRKGAQDAKKAKMFAKIAREITVAAKMGGTDASSNPRLRAALASAREKNMPKDNIERAIAKASGPDGDSNYDDVRYEGYGPGGVAIIVESLTDNRNRTASDVRSVFSKFGGNLGEVGSVSFGFDRKGHLIYTKEIGDFDKIFEIATELNAENVEEVEDYIEILSAIDDFSNLRENFIKQFGDPQESGLIWLPKTLIDCSEETKNSIIKMIDLLEDNDDVQHVYNNVNF
ncbi:MAG: YebC/PmpR family DNA-binding transcriptional regulator [Alphaproteobacteria bacterium]|nr:YebC/PmpR family DNA-binding transcriptional regulator [Alphaproteobacteria bacterium]